MSLRAEILGRRGHPGVLPGLPPAHHTTGWPWAALIPHAKNRESFSPSAPDPA